MNAVRELTQAELDQVNGGKIVTETRNPQGKVTQGQGKAQEDVAVNPAGNEPPGQQP